MLFSRVYLSINVCKINIEGVEEKKTASVSTVMTGIVGGILKPAHQCELLFKGMCDSCL